MSAMAVLTMARRLALLFLITITTVAAGQTRTYTVDARSSRVMIVVGRAGFFRFAGHKHEVVAPSMTGEVAVDSTHTERSTVRLSFDAPTLRVTGRGEPAEDVPKVQATMLGPKVLDVERFPAITFRSDSVTVKGSSPGAWDLQVRGDLVIHGVTRRILLLLRVQMKGDSLRAAGATVLRQSDYGIKPISIAHVVKVKDELEVLFDIVARIL
jgi:polyisoprenoid-binding protein YceI